MVRTYETLLALQPLYGVIGAPYRPVPGGPTADEGDDITYPLPRPSAAPAATPSGPPAAPPLTCPPGDRAGRGGGGGAERAYPWSSAWRRRNFLRQARET